MSSTGVKNLEIEKEKEKNNGTQKLDYEILLEDFSYFDLSFKVIVIGNSGKKILIIFIYI